MAYSKTVNLNISDVGPDKKLKLQSLNLMFQFVASEHSELIGLGKSNTTDKDLKWIIVRGHIEYIRRPVYNEKITITTYPTHSNGMFFYRDFIIADEKGNRLITSSTVWCVLDKKTNTIVNKPFNVVLAEEHFENEPVPAEKIFEDGSEFVYSKKIKYSDLDINQHVNNTKYIELMLDVHDSLFYNEHEFKSSSINYLKEIKEGDEVFIYRSGTNPEFITGKVNDEVCFRGKFEYYR